MQMPPLREKKQCYILKILILKLNNTKERKKSSIIEETPVQKQKQHEKPRHIANHTRTTPNENDLEELPDKEFKRMIYKDAQIIQKSQKYPPREQKQTWMK